VQGGYSRNFEVFGYVSLFYGEVYYVCDDWGDGGAYHPQTQGALERFHQRNVEILFC